MNNEEEMTRVTPDTVGTQVATIPVALSTRSWSTSVSSSTRRRRRPSRK